MLPTPVAIDAAPAPPPRPPTPTVPPRLPHHLRRRGASPAPQAKGRRGALLGIGILVAFLLVYGLSLFGFHLLAKSSAPLKTPDLTKTDDTVVLDPAGGAQDRRKSPHGEGACAPEDNMFDKRLDVLTARTAVRMYPRERPG